MVLISMIVLQSVPVTYVSGSDDSEWLNTEPDTFTSEPEGNSQMTETSEMEPEQEIQTDSEQQSEPETDFEQQPESFSDGITSQGESDGETEIPSGNGEQQKTDVSETPSGESETDNTITDGEKNETVSGENADSEQSETSASDTANPEEENEDIWKNSIASAELTGDFSKDIVAIARTQLGVQENKDNYMTTPEGVTAYYSRYGQWAGNAYEEWATAFVSFCANYAGISQQYLPKGEKTADWVQQLETMSLHISKEGYIPKEGDLVFFYQNQHAEGNSQIQTEIPGHTGIVTGADEQTVYTIEGNCGGMVQEETYAVDSDDIYGYLRMDLVKKAAGLLIDDSQSAVDTEVTPEETEPPEISPEEMQPTEVPEVSPTETPEISPTETPEPSPTENPDNADAEVTKYDYQSEEVNVKVTLTDPSDLPDDAKLVVTPVEISQEAQDQIEQEAVKENKSIEKIHSYDIRFMVDEEEVQPGDTVKVEVSIPEDENVKEADVYHVDEQDQIENMDGNVNEEGNIEFETTHFSTYVIVNKGTSEVTVRLQHYCEDTKIYADTVRTVNVGGSIPDYRATENYTVQKAVIVKDGTETEITDKSEIQIVSDTVVKIYYEKKTTNNIEGDVTFYDYQIRPGNGKTSINDGSHYSDTNTNNRMTMGTKQSAGVEWNAYGTNGLNANECNYKSNTGGVGTLGLVTGLSGDYKTVLWSVDQPGFFTDENLGDSTGKQKYTNYKLNFSRNGNDYSLVSVKRPDGTTANAGADFYPFRNQTIISDNDGNSGNYYFGMRYDIEFKLGDYVGPLTYKFTGDDDLWVLLDGKVVIDVGGIHDAIEKSTNLWEDLGFTGDARPATDDEKNAVHRITVLYMERGAGESNCQMNFTIPDARFVDVTNVPLADFSFQKVNSSGAALKGARFKLVSDGGSITYPLTESDENGIVSFRNLKVGTYTLTETMAPDNYMASKETYKVIVSLENDAAVARLYKSDGVTEVTDRKIVNYTEKEEAVSNLTSNKKATAVDENNRIFQIDLNAEVTGRKDGEDPRGASIILVMDASGSMEGSGKSLNDIQTAAKNFVKTAGEASSDSEISVIWYQGTEAGNPNYSEDTKITVSDFYQLNDSGIASLNTAINSGKASGGTPMGEALEKTYDKLKSAKYPDKYVLFFTDGMPGHQDGADSWNCKVANRAYEAAKKIKEAATLYTVGYSLSGTLRWTPGHSSTSASAKDHGEQHNNTTSAKDYLSNYIASKGCAYTTGNSAGLSKIFTDLAGKIGDLFTVQPEQIVDVIDSRFELTEQSEKDLLKLNEGKETPVVEIIKNKENGTTKIIWTGEAARIGNKEAEDPAKRGWKASFKIKAKDDFIGGNMVPTNGAESGIYLEKDSVKYFPRPSVNVKLLSLGIEDREVTVFKGDTISPVTYAGELLDTLFIRELVKKSQNAGEDGNSESGNSGSSENKDEAFVITKTGLENLKFPTLSDEQRTILNKEGSLTLGESGNFAYEYTYPGSSDAVGYFTFTYHTAVKENGTAWGNMEDHTAEQSGKDVEKYQLTVTYHPYARETRKAMPALSGIQEPDLPDSAGNSGGTEVTESDITPTTGTCTVHVIAGELQIRKKLTVEAAADTTFTFVVKKDGKEIATATATVKKGETTARSEKLEDLARGVYVITENDTEGYMLERITKGSDTNCQSEFSDNTTSGTAAGLLHASFTIGTGEDGKDALTSENMQNKDGRLGVAEFTNIKLPVLPDTGSTGTFWFTISGAAFMAGALLLYINKRKEDKNL